MASNFRVSGIVCELNPLHNGHAGIFHKMREFSDGIVAVMSGNFVQRGDAAVFDKWTRAECALAAGADLVIELPLPWATAGAEHFARAAVSILQALGGVDFLAFGSECGNLEQIRQIASVLDTPEFRSMFLVRKKEMEGMPFAVIRQDVVESLLGAEAGPVLTEPNNILGIEYVRALLALGSKIEPVTIRRSGAAYHESSLPDSSIPSATQMRRILLEDPDTDLSPYMPEACSQLCRKMILELKGPASLYRLETAILAHLRRLPEESYSVLPEASEGLDRLFRQSVQQAVSLDDLYTRMKSKRYSLSRIRRLVLCAFLGIRKSDVFAAPPYCRILAMNQKGIEILAQSSRNTSVPIITRHAQSRDLSAFGKRVYALECLASDLYALALPQTGTCGSEMQRGIIVR